MTDMDEAAAAATPPAQPRKQAAPERAGATAAPSEADPGPAIGAAETPPLPATISNAPAVYPPRVLPPAKPIAFPRFLFHFVRNPLEVLPEAVYHQDVTSVTSVVRLSWICAPDLIEQVLVRDRALYPKTPIERRVLSPLLGDGLLTARDEVWRWQRQAMAPLFRQATLLGYVPAMVAAGEAQVARWREALDGSPDGVLREDIEAPITAMTFEVITSTVLTGGAPPIERIIERATGDYLGPISWPIAYSLINLPRWAPFPGQRAMRRAERDLRRGVGELIDTRRAEIARGAPVADDILTRMLGTRTPEGEPWPRALLIDALLTLVSAGHETTAKALTWALYLLARAPAWADALAAEADAAMREGALDGESVATDLPLTQAFLRETMRLYPPGPVLTRYACEDTQLGAHRMHKDQLVVVPIYALHRHRKLWRDPDRFDPSRFLGPQGVYPRTQYMPFGAGARVCIGASFAMLEATALLATLARGFRFAPGVDAKGREHQPKPISRVTLRPKGGMPLVIRAR
ncbi:MAG: cytochrome P450 [Pseudomonadota bacterium]